MKKTTITCDACSCVLKVPFIQVEDADFCEFCCSRIIEKYINQEHNKGKVLRSKCKKCNGTGKAKVRDDEATNSFACCGENRTEYKIVTCTECIL